MTIALLSYSTSWSESRSEQVILSTGKVDSVVVSISDIRKVNEKLIELKYEKEINKHLKEVVETDSIIIKSLQESIAVADERHKEAVKGVKRERNIFGGISIVSVILLFISLL